MVTAFEKFDFLPEKIKDWLASDQLSYSVGEIEEKIRPAAEKKGVIAYLVLQLTTSDLKPQELIAEIMTQLEFDFLKAKKLAFEIEERLLGPMRMALKTELDIDIELIKEGKEKPRIEKPVIKEEMPAFIKEEALRRAQAEAIRPAQAEPAPLPISEIKLPEAEKPFIISEEKPEIPVIPEAPRPTFIFKTEIPVPPLPPRPVTAKVEAGNPEPLG